MELPIYDTLEIFKREFQLDYDDFKESMTYLKYLRECKKRYGYKYYEISDTLQTEEYYNLQNIVSQSINELRSELKNEDLLSIENELFEYAPIIFLKGKRHFLDYECGLYIEDFHISKNNFIPEHEREIKFSKDTYRYFLYENYPEKTLKKIYNYLEAKENLKNFIDINHSKPFQRTQKIIRFLDEKIEAEKNLLFRNNGQSQPPTTEEPERQPKEKILINGEVQTLGYIFKLLIDGGYIDPLGFKSESGRPNKTATAEMFLSHFEFTDNFNKQPSAEYLKKAIFENSLSMNKAEDFRIPHINFYDKDR